MIEKICEFNENIGCSNDYDGPTHCNLCLVAMLVVEIRRLRVTGIQP